MAVTNMKKIQEMWVDKSKSSNNLYNLYPKTLSDLVLLNSWDAETPITLSQAFNSSGVLDVAHGGSGATTAAAALKTFLGGSDDAATATELNYCHGVTSAIQTQIDGKIARTVTFDGVALTSDGTAIHHYGVCETEAVTAEKVVTLPGYVAVNGAKITVKFVNANSAAAITLNVNGTGAKSFNLADPTLIQAGDLFEIIFEKVSSEDAGVYKLVGTLKEDKNYYPTAMSWTGGTTAGPTATITMAGGPSDISVGAIPAASGVTDAEASGIVTTGDQSFAGKKTFVGGVVANSVAPSATAGSALGSASVAYANAYIDAIAPVTAAGSYLGTSTAKYASAYIDEVNGALKGNADTATKLAATKNIGITGTGVVATAAAFDGSADVNIALTDLGAELITSGTIDIARLPEGALPKLKVVADLAAFQLLTKSDVQNGDTVKVTAAISDATFGTYNAGQMFYIVDDSKLTTTSTPTPVADLKAACEPYTAVVDWSSILSKPTTVSGYGITDAKITVKGGSEASDTFTVSANNGAETFEIAGSGAASTSVSGKTITLNAVDKYPTAMAWTDGTTAGPTATITMAGDGVAETPAAISVAAFPSASDSASGIVTTAAQTFAGQKTFAGGIITGADIVSDTALTDNLGSAAVPFAAEYVGAIHVESAASTSVIDVDASTVSINPATNETGTIGTSDKKWANGYFKTLHGALDGNASTATKLETARVLEGVSFDGSANVVHYAVCDTVASTAAKQVTCNGFSYVAGARIIVKFTYANTGTGVTLDVSADDGTTYLGGKSICLNGSTTGTDNIAAGLYELIYDGTNFVVIAGMNNEVGMGTAEPTNASSSFYFQELA